MLKWVNHLLNLIENYNGILILTSNHPESMDPAFSRRIEIKARFYNPDVPQMKILLQKMLLPDAPLASNLNLDEALNGIVLSGGLLRNALERLVVKMERFGFDEITTDLLHSVLNETQIENSHLIEEEKRIGLV
jgi:SpoVK/Ycf46/Vps4 family AAA+-type ATPase